MKFYDYTRHIQLDLSIGDDTELTVHFDAEIEDDRILIDCDGWRVTDSSGFEIILNQGDVLRVEAKLEGLARSVIEEYEQTMAEWRAEGRYHGHLD